MCNCSYSSDVSSAQPQSSTSCGKASGLTRIGRGIATGFNAVRGYVTQSFAFLFAFALTLIYSTVAMAQTPPPAVETPELPVLVDFSGLMDALVSSIQGYMGLVMVLIIALGAVIGFLAWTVGKRRTV